MKMKWLHFAAASLIAATLLVWYGAPLLPILAGAALVGLWKLAGHRSEHRP